MSEHEPTAAEVREILERIPDALAHADEGRAQARGGEGIPLDALADLPAQPWEEQ
jgi:hypothetical protein